MSRREFASLSPQARRFLKLRGLVWTVRFGALAVLGAVLIRWGVVH